MVGSYLRRLGGGVMLDTMWITVAFLAGMAFGATGFVVWMFFFS